MRIQQLFTSCLAEMTYYVSDSGEAAIIDPLRDPYPYIRMAEAEGSTIKYVFLTHFHADFISGHLDLAKKTGATIVFGPGAKADFDFYEAKDLEKFPIGQLFIQVLHTPGHTLESSSLLLINQDGNTPCVFTGDCLFLDDVGRPDLATVSGSITKEDLAGLQYDSLRNRIMPLPDDIIVYPNHGSGSACGKHMKSDTFDTLGNQKQTNYALRSNMSKEEFTHAVLKGLTQPPQYFPKNARLNKGDMPDFDGIIHRATTPLSPETFKKLSEDPEFLVIDTRKKEDMLNQGTLKNAWFIGIDGNFASWVGQLVEAIDQKILFIANNESEVREIATRFSRVGYDNVRGYLFGSIHNWINQGYQIEQVNSITAEELAASNHTYQLIDLRPEQDYLLNPFEGAKNIPLEYLFTHLNELDEDDTYYLYCTSGYRSLVGTTILNSKGFQKVFNLNDTYEDIKRVLG